MNPEPRFLSTDEILVLHAIAIEDQGGASGVRDRGLLESAMAMPPQRFSGRYLHEDVPAMAAAYAFHICSNHPFVDGNKRAAVAAMVAFLADNGWRFDATADDAEPVVLELAAGALSKSEFTEWARNHMHEKPRLELREFFTRITTNQFSDRFHSLLPAETGAPAGEFEARSVEAALSMPFLRGLANEQAAARASGEQKEWERITVLAVGMMALHAIAEDMGYEW